MNINAGSLVIGTQMLGSQGSIVMTNKGKSRGPILTLRPRLATHDLEAGSSKNMMDDPKDPKPVKKLINPKYVRPKWCPPGLTKMEKRKLQWLRNKEQAEKEAEWARYELFEQVHPRILSRVWAPKTTGLEATIIDALDSTNKLAEPALATEEDVTLVPTSATTYSSWADEVEAADLLEKES
jgi:hypothetical protein